MNDHYVKVPWTHGTSVAAGEPEVRVVPTRSERCAHKARMVLEDIRAWQQRLQVEPDDNARAFIASQVAFQQQRLEWLEYVAVTPADVLIGQRALLREQVGPRGLIALETGLTIGLPEETLIALAKLALVDYVLGES